ncbi:MAG: GGDEF domain-containing protein [Oligoflexales bacterium]
MIRPLPGFNRASDNIDNSIEAFILGLTKALQSIIAVDVKLKNSEKLVLKKKFTTKYTTIASVPLSGSITGELFICVNKNDWLPYLSQISGIDENASEMQELLYSSLQEIINTAGGEAIVPIKETFGSVTMMSPRLIEGTLVYPSTRIYEIDLITEDGKEIEARMSLDLMEQDLNVEHERLKQDSKLDDTGLFNKKYFLEILAKFEEKFKKEGYFSIIFADINRLKFVNDTYGHDAGDAYIQTAANIIKQSCRFSDFCFRVGGDELVILLPKCTKEDTTHVINRMESLMANEVMKFDNSKGVMEDVLVHMSVGTASTSEGIAATDILKTADQRMEENKKEWYRNQVFTRRT